MELFHGAKVVRLRSRHDKYLYADEDEVHVVQDRNGASPNARWAVERVPHSPDGLRLRSRYGRYLTASNQPFLLAASGRKVLQTLPGRLHSSVEWEPLRDGLKARLRTRYGNYLRANSGLPPWRNSVTHDVPHRSSTQDWVLWDVEIVHALEPCPVPTFEQGSQPSPVLRPPPAPPSPHVPHQRPEKPYKAQPSPPPPPGDATATSAEASPPPEHRLAKLESLGSFSAPLHKLEARAIHYHIADDAGNVDDDEEGHSFTFDGTGLEELMARLQEETGLLDIIMCSRNPITGKLIPLRLQLPPNNAAMHIVLVRESSKVAKSFP